MKLCNSHIGPDILDPSPCILGSGAHSFQEITKIFLLQLLVTWHTMCHLIPKSTVGLIDMVLAS